MLPGTEGYFMPVRSCRTRGRAGVEQVEQYRVGAAQTRAALRGRDAVHGDATEKLRIKIGGFLRQDFAGSGDFHDLLDLAWIQKEADLRAAGVDGVESGSRFAFVKEMSFRGHGLRRDAQSGLEDSFVEQDDIQFALKRRDTRKKLGQIDAVAERENVVGASL